MRMTRDEFLDLVSDLIGEDTEILAQKRDVETMFERRREGAAWAVLSLKRAGLLNVEGEKLVKEWESQRLDNLPDLKVEGVSIVPSYPT